MRAFDQIKQGPHAVPLLSPLSNVTRGGGHNGSDEVKLGWPVWAVILGCVSCLICWPLIIIYYVFSTCVSPRGYMFFTLAVFVLFEVLDELTDYIWLHKHTLTVDKYDSFTYDAIVFWLYFGGIILNHSFNLICVCVIRNLWNYGVGNKYTNKQHDIIVYTPPPLIFVPWTTHECRVSALPLQKSIQCTHTLPYTRQCQFH